MVKKKKKSTKSKKSKDSVDNFNGYTQTVEEMINEAVVSTTPNIALAKQLEGFPKIFDEQHSSDLRVLVAEGIASRHGNEGFARGCQWRSKVLKR